MNGSTSQNWGGEYGFVLHNLLLKDFRVRYRNMSLGIGWSLANPLVMMGVLTFIFTRVFPDLSQPQFPVFVLCGLIPFNFFTLAWVTSTNSLVENAGLIKRTRFPREIVPITVVLGNCLHFVIQLGLLIVFAMAFGNMPDWRWLWLPVVVLLEVIFVIGLGLAFSAMDVYVRDVRYVVESFNVVFFWIVPIFYHFDKIPERYRIFYEINPIAAVVMAFRNVILEGKEPAASLLWKMSLVSFLSLGVGLFVFERLKRRFYDYL